MSLGLTAIHRLTSILVPKEGNTHTHTCTFLSIYHPVFSNFKIYASSVRRLSGGDIT